MIDDDIIENIIENFHNIIPKQYFDLIKKSDIFNLINNDILKIIKDELLKDDYKIDEIINGIIITAIDTIKQTITRNFSQDVIKEIFCQMIEILSKDDMNDIKILEIISENLIKYTDFDYKNIDIDALVENVMHYVIINQIEELNSIFLKNLGDQLIDKFIEIDERNQNETKGKN